MADILQQLEDTKVDLAKAETEIVRLKGMLKRESARVEELSAALNEQIQNVKAVSRANDTRETPTLREMVHHLSEENGALRQILSDHGITDIVLPATMPLDTPPEVRAQAIRPGIDEPAAASQGQWDSRDDPDGESEACETTRDT